MVTPDKEENKEIPVNVIDSGEYQEPITFETDGEAVLFYSYLEQIEYIASLKNRIEEIEKENKEFAEWISDIGWRYGLFEDHENEWHLPCEETGTMFRTTTELLEIFRSGKEIE